MSVSVGPGKPPPVLAAGALAAANFTIDFDGTDFAFLEGPGWLLAIVIALVTVASLWFTSRSRMRQKEETVPGGITTDIDFEREEDETGHT